MAHSGMMKTKNHLKIGIYLQARCEEMVRLMCMQMLNNGGISFLQGSTVRDNFCKALDAWERPYMLVHVDGQAGYAASTFVERCQRYVEEGKVVILTGTDHLVLSDNKWMRSQVAKLISETPNVLYAGGTRYAKELEDVTTKLDLHLNITDGRI